MLRVRLSFTYTYTYSDGYFTGSFQVIGGGTTDTHPLSNPISGTIQYRFYYNADPGLTISNWSFTGTDINGIAHTFSAATDLFHRDDLYFVFNTTGLGSWGFMDTCRNCHPLPNIDLSIYYCPLKNNATGIIKFITID